MKLKSSYKNVLCRIYSEMLWFPVISPSLRYPTPYEYPLVTEHFIVFFRILEYYDGILILTSNRVGVFDEGFKSRIQLALHYDNLSLQTRQKVWENFFDRIETFDEDIDIPDLRKNVGKLSRYNLNGREIRNAITTARQLASFNGKSLDYSCLRDVIGVTTRFDMYLKDRVNEGLDDDELAKEKGLR